MPATVDVAQDWTVIESITDRLYALKLMGDDQMTPDEVIFLIDDICITIRCTRDALPSAVLLVYHDAERRRDDPSYGRCNFIIRNFILDMERALRLV